MHRVYWHFLRDILGGQKLAAWGPDFCSGDALVRLALPGIGMDPALLTWTPRDVVMAPKINVAFL